MVIDPDKIHLVQTGDGEMVRLQKQMSKAVWRICPGRRRSYLVKQDDELLGLLHLSSPNMNIGAVVKHLNLDPSYKVRGKQLRNYMDLSVCVGRQPWAWYWNLGKLVALLSTCKEISDAFQERYGDELRGITTFSLYGRSTQYNRIFKLLGYTKGHGNQHISDDDYRRMKRWLIDNNKPIPRRGRLWTVKEWNRYHPEERVSVKHGCIRGVYYKPCEGKPMAQIVREWYWRWGLPRWEKHKDLDPPYLTGLDNAS